MPQTLTQIGKYRVERELGRGAMGVVYKAFDPDVERIVAIKTIRLDVEDSEELAHRLRREAKSVGQLGHTNIVTLFEAGEWRGLFYLVMEFIQGETLDARIRRQRWFTLKEVQGLFRQICAGLDFAHQRGVIHRDIKPANIMITEEGTVKLADFGIAKHTGAGTSTHGLIVGTPSYMSPEQALGKPLDGRSDIFSLGSILYELLTGEKAFPGQNTTTVMYKIVHESPTPVRALQPGLDPAVETLVLKALAKAANDRFSTCADLAAALEQYIDQAMAAEPKTSVLTVPPPPAVSSNAPPSTTASGISPAATAPGASGTMPPVASQPSSPTASAVAPQTTTFPIAWLGAGILGTLLLVIVILLILQMRRPTSGSVEDTPVVNTANAHQPATPRQIGQQANSQQNSTPASNPPEKSSPPQDVRPTSRERKATLKRATPPAASPGGTAPVSKPSTPPQVTTSQPKTISTTAPAQPEDFNSYLLKGDLAFQENKYQEALNNYSKAYKLNPYNSEVKNKLAVTLTLLGRIEEAQKYK